MGIRRNEKGQVDYRDMFNGMCTVESIKRLCDSLIEQGYGHYGAVFAGEDGKYYAVCLGASMRQDTSSAWEEKPVVIPESGTCSLAYSRGHMFINYDEIVYFD